MKKDDFFIPSLLADYKKYERDFMPLLRKRHVLLKQLEEVESKLRKMLEEAGISRKRAYFPTEFTQAYRIMEFLKKQSRPVTTKEIAQHLGNIKSNSIKVYVSRFGCFRSVGRKGYIYQEPLKI